jgi:mannose-6-phosphate isomerase-like protein (cupin superfamily)
MFKEPVIIPSFADRNGMDQLNDTAGKSFVIHEWKGSGPDYLHVHYEDDEAWYVIEGSLTFRFADRTVEAAKGTTVFVPAGVPHTYTANSPARYLIILTPRLNDLISELQTSPYNMHASVMKKYKSEIIN